MRIRLTCFIALAAASGGCGVSDSDWFPDDLDEHAQLSDVSDANRARVCDAFEDWLVGQYSGSLYTRIACTALGIETTSDAGACGDYVRDCIDNPPPEVQAIIDELVAAVGCAGLAYESSGCSKTLSDLKQCLDDASREVDELQYTLECAAAGQPLASDALVPDVPESCRAIELACP